MTDAETRATIHVAITCAKNGAATGRYCPTLEERIPAQDASAWYAATIAEHGWTVDDDGNAYCPRHNPADNGTPIILTSEGYLPLGDSGWEARARFPDGARYDVSFATIEIRPRRWLTSTDPEPGRDVVVEEADGTRWHRTDDGDRDGAANWEKVGVDYFEPETWTHVAGNCGPVRVAAADG